jgi:hypothetical protein
MRSLFAFHWKGFRFRHIHAGSFLFPKRQRLVGESGSRSALLAEENKHDGNERWEGPYTIRRRGQCSLTAVNGHGRR